MNIREFIVNANNRLNGVFSSFNHFSSKFSSRNRLIDIFPSHYFFYFIDRKNKEGRKLHICKLNELTLQVLIDSKMATVISDMSIKNQVAILIVHIHIKDNSIIKTLHHVINITSTEAELFAIRYSINQAIQLVNINCIIVITDLIYAAKQIFDSSV